ncbi:hypothetical protein DKX38_022892 [Salix brachista]|uniref:Uncharacterized protein n=1 Tax=Salix brachista TaxID=2182728 RepID=A0A5N5K574_9ROSI|nr:hypothetical protein DKX38_022892 [Salix brachista]
MGWVDTFRVLEADVAKMMCRVVVQWFRVSVIVVEKKCEALRNEGAALASWNSHHSFHYNRAPDLGNGQVYQGERPINGVSSLGGSRNKPKVSLMALQLAGVILVPSLTPQTAGGNVHAGALPRWRREGTLSRAIVMLTGSPILAEFGIQKESRKEFENEKQKLPNVEIHNEMPAWLGDSDASSHKFDSSTCEFLDAIYHELL